MASKAYYEKNKERERAKARAYYHANKERFKAYYEENKLDYIERSLQRNYGMGIEEVEALYASQDGECALCGIGMPPFEWGTKSKSVHAPEVDHCHDNGHVRGILCRSCNTGLGKFKDNPILLERAIRYLL